MKYEVRNAATAHLKAVVGIFADRIARRNGSRELRTFEMTVLPGKDGFEAGTARSDIAQAFIFGGKGGYIGIIRVNRPLWTLEKQLLGKRCGPFCDIMGIDALCVSCGSAPGVADRRAKKANAAFFSSPFCNECLALLKRAWDERVPGLAVPGDLPLPGSSADLRVITEGPKADKIVYSYTESLEPVSDEKLLYYIIKEKIPARLRPSESGAGVIIMKSEIRFAAGNKE